MAENAEEASKTVLDTDTKTALHTLQRVVTITRYFALTGTDAATLARLLDETDYLISLIRHGEEQPGEFEQALRDIGREFPDFASLAEECASPVTV